MTADAARLLVQIAAILGASTILGALCRRLKQPRVVGQMTAGLLLGPTLFGRVAPATSSWLFGEAGLAGLSGLSQIGLLLFMFAVGASIEISQLRRWGHLAVLVSHVSIVVPFTGGALLALALYPTFSDDSVTFMTFALFIGTAMSVTAFPVLARILSEQSLLKSTLGSLTMTCAAVDDVTGWCLLAGVIALARAGHAAMPVWLPVAGLIVFVLVMVFAVRPALEAVLAGDTGHGGSHESEMATVLLLLIGSALVTEWLGIHSVFGAFLAGAILPKGRRVVRSITERLGSVSVALLLPLYFALTGLRTRVGLIDGPDMWMWCAIVIAVATLGKLGGCALALRIVGSGWRTAASIGVLMNTRGLMELVVLNIGLDLGVISPAMFSILVLMAVATTAMTTPLLAVIHRTPAGPADVEFMRVDIDRVDLAATL